MKTLRSSGLLFIFIGILGYAVFPIQVKLIQRSGMQPLDIATWRFTFALPLIWLLIVALRLRRPEQPLPRRGLMAIGIIMGLAALSAFFGLQRLPAGLYVLLFYSYPAMVALINFLRGERLPVVSWLALLLTLVGIALIVPKTDEGLGDEALTGVILAFVNAFLVALYFVLNNHLVKDGRAARRASAWTINGAFLTIWVITLLRRELNVPPDINTGFLVLSLAFFSTVVPVFMYTIGIQRLGASRAAIISTVEPVGTNLLSVLLLGEHLEPVQLLGGAVILGSVLLLQVTRTRMLRAAVPLAGGD